MQKVGVVFGGRSVEHEVSVITGMQVIENIDREKYDPIAIYMTKDGKFLTGEVMLDFKTYKSGDFSQAIEVFPRPVKGDGGLYQFPKSVGLFGKMSNSLIDEVDVIFPALHGTYGEDGCFQGLLELMDIPYVGSSVLAASVGMDKILMKDVFKSYEIPVVEYVWFYRNRWFTDKELILDHVESRLEYPLFVKPANLGSSIGITKANDKQGLIDAIEIAVKYDRKILVEEAVENVREINGAVLGKDDEIEVSLLEEPVGWQEILSYEDKYMNASSKTGGKSNGERRIIPADLPDELREKIEELAKQCFMSIDCSGVARIDFLLSSDGSVYANEINTLPGSISFYLWEKKGLSMKDLITKLIEIAVLRHEEKAENITSIDTGLYNKIAYGSKLK